MSEIRVALTWLPDNGRPETLYTSLPETELARLRGDIGKPALHNDILSILVSTTPGGAMRTSVFRWGRITALEKHDG